MSFLDDVGGILKDAAPFLASALPGPLGDVAKGILHGVFGTKNDDDLAAAIQKATPDQILALKKSDQDFQVQMARIAADRAKAADDADAARLKSFADVETAEVQSTNKYTAAARPTGVYAAVACTIFLVVVVGVCMLNGTKVDWGAVAAMGSLIAPLWGYSAYYVNQRTAEKLNGKAT